MTEEGKIMDISTIITFIKQIVATFTALISMFIPAADTAGVAYGAEKQDELIMSFSAVSDTHVETNNPEAYNAFSALINGVKAGKDHSAAIFVGDNVMNGQLLENFFFYMGVKAVNPAEHNLVALGNHDIGNGNGDYDKFRKNYLNNNRLYLGNKLENTYYFRVINGCYMIFLASEELCVNDFVMSNEQTEWLKNVLKEADAADAPVFVFNHHPVYRIREDNANTLADILNQYDNLLYIHGHTHDQLGADNFYTYNGIDCICLPRSTEIVDYKPGDGIVVEVYNDEILVRGRNFIDGEWIDELNYTYPLDK